MTYMQILKKSPWEDFKQYNQENIFVKSKKNQLNLDGFNFSKKTIFIALAIIFVILIASGVYKVDDKKG